MSVDQARIDRTMRIWYQTMEATHEMILAGLRLNIDAQVASQNLLRSASSRISDKLRLLAGGLALR
ncbi:MAG: hypothetical protein IT422_25625 [Pirellulaceae bacterium]|nr:hypothetical protein [Pirellulaceae bacterium]